MNFKTLSFLVLSIFLLTAVSAMTVYADFSDSTQSKTINQGQSITFNVDFFSMNTPMTMKAQLYQGNNLIYTFLNTNTNNRIYYNTYTYTPPIGTFEIRVTGTDNVNTDSEYLTLIVNPIIQPPVDTTPPVITLLGVNPQTIIQGNPYTELGATATDNVDGDITNEILIDSSDVDTNTVGTYFVTYDVEDSSGNQAITKIRIVNVISQSPTNHAPLITSSPITSITEGNIYNYDVDATDIDGDNLVYSLTQNPSWLTINPNSGLITGTAPLVDSNTDYDITVEVSDGNGGIDTQTYILKVKNYISGGITETTRIIADDFYEKNKYFDQFETGKTIYTEKPISKNIDLWVLLYIILAIIGLGIILVIYLLFRNIRK